MIPRRSVLAAGAAAAILSAAACSAPKDPSAQPAGGAPASGASGGVPTKPSSPVKLNILDVAGNLKLTQPMINNFKKEKTDFVSDITTETGGAPDLVGTLKPQVDTGNLKIDLVLTGSTHASRPASPSWRPPTPTRPRRCATTCSSTCARSTRTC